MTSRPFSPAVAASPATTGGRNLSFPGLAAANTRVRLAIEGYTYGHFPIVAGIVTAAVGVRGVLGRADHGQPLGVFYAVALFGGFALYLAGHVLFKQRMHDGLSLSRIITVGLLLALLPAAASVPPLAALAGLVVILTGLIAVETIRYAAVRRALRDGSAGDDAAAADQVTRGGRG